MPGGAPRAHEFLPEKCVLASTSPGVVDGVCSTYRTDGIDRPSGFSAAFDPQFRFRAFSLFLPFPHLRADIPAAPGAYFPITSDGFCEKARSRLGTLREV